MLKNTGLYHGNANRLMDWECGYMAGLIREVRAALDEVQVRVVRDRLIEGACLFAVGLAWGYILGAVR